MMTVAEPVPSLVSLQEAQAFLRIDAGDEEALLAGLIRTASTLCEQFIGRSLIERPFREMLSPNGDWQRLRSLPIRSMVSVMAIDQAGRESPMPSDVYTIDIDAEGHGWVRCRTAAGRMQVAVTGTAGSVSDPNGVPEPLRQGVLRLVAHLFTDRDGQGSAPPAAVTALWRPYRRMGLAA